MLEHGFQIMEKLAWMLAGAGVTCLSVAVAMATSRRRSDKDMPYSIGVTGPPPELPPSPANDAELILKRDWRDNPISPTFGR
jgi:hypothetical protein